MNPYSLLNLPDAALFRVAMVVHIKAKVLGSLTTQESTAQRCKR